MVKLMAYFRMVGDPRVDAWVKWGITQKDPVTEASVEEAFGFLEDEDEVVSYTERRRDASS